MATNKNISVWRGEIDPPTNYHQWVKEDASGVYLGTFVYDGSTWKRSDSDMDGIFVKLQSDTVQMIDSDITIGNSKKILLEKSDASQANGLGIGNYLSTIKNLYNNPNEVLYGAVVINKIVPTVYDDTTVQLNTRTNINLNSTGNGSIDNSISGEHVYNSDTDAWDDSLRIFVLPKNGKVISSASNDWFKNVEIWTDLKRLSDFNIGDTFTEDLTIENHSGKMYDPGVGNVGGRIQFSNGMSLEYNNGVLSFIYGDGINSDVIKNINDSWIWTLPINGQTITQVPDPSNYSDGEIWGWDILTTPVQKQTISIEQIEIGSESEPLCLNHSAKPEVGINDHIVVNYTSETGTQLRGELAYMSDVSEKISEAPATGDGYVRKNKTWELLRTNSDLTFQADRITALTNDTQNKLNNKVDKISTTSVIYSVNSTGTQSSIPYSQTAVASSLPRRTTSGDIAVPTNVTGDNAIGATQVDNKISTSIATKADSDDVVFKGGGTMTGALILNGDPDLNLEAATKQYVDSKVGTGYSFNGDYFNNSGSSITLKSNSIDDVVINTISKSKIMGLETDLVNINNSISSSIANIAAKINRSGDTMTGDLSLYRDPIADSHAVTKKYTDTKYTEAVALSVQKSGSTMTGSLILNSAPTTDNMASTKKYVDDQIATAKSGALTFSGFISTSEPTSDVREGNYWYNSSDWDTNFPWDVKTYTSGAWSSTTTQYTPSALDLWSRLSDDAGYYYFAENWDRLDFSGNSFNDAQFVTTNGVINIRSGGITNAEIANNANIDASKINLSGYVTIESFATKANDNDVVHLTGDEIINGVKTFNTIAPRTSFVPDVATSLTNKTYVDAQDALKADANELNNHITNISNPHLVTKTQIGLGNVDNTSDANKPISTSVNTALGNKANDIDVVHKNGAETITGTKTFSVSPIVPTPTALSHSSTKGYVDDLIALKQDVLTVSSELILSDSNLSLNEWYGTQVDYDALAVKDVNVKYYIYE